jgi:cysteine sulfinate desulfinase/cysteine desulfurase-like protein
VLISLGLSRDEAYSALRISLGRENTADEINRLMATFAKILKNP